MNGSDNPDQIKKLEQELRECIQRQDFLEALDICEEIEGQGAFRAAHAVARGQCFLRLRRKQDARTALMKAFELDPGFEPAIKLLDENFPGWERTKTARPAPAPRPAPPQVPPAYQPTPPYAGQPAPAPTGYAMPPAQAYQPQPTPMPGYATPTPPTPYGVPGMAPQPMYAPQGYQSSPNLGQVPYQPQTMRPQTDTKINWAYVMEDLTTARKELETVQQKATESAGSPIP